MSITDSATVEGGDGAEASAPDLDSLIAEAAAEANPGEGADVEVEDDESTEDVAEGTEATSEVTTEGEKYTVKVDGQEIEVDLDELLNGYQRQSDYTRKTQALKEQSERYAAFDALDKAFAEDPVGTLRSLALSLGVTDLGGAGAEESAEQFDPDDPVASRVMELERQVQEANAILQQQETARRQEAVDRELDAVKTKFNQPDLDETALLRFAIDNGISNLEMAYRAMKYEEASAAPKPPEQKLAKKRAKPKVEGGSSRNVGVVPGSSDTPSLEEAWALSWREASA